MRRTRRIQRLWRPRSLVTVIVTVSGGAAHLDDCIESLLDSRVVSQILLVAGDGQAAEVLRAHHPLEGRVRVLGESDPSQSLDGAVAAARGKWLAFADADDVIPPGAFERLLAAARRDTDVVLGIDSGNAPPPWLRLVPTDGTRLLERAGDHAHVLVDLALSAKLFRRYSWRRAEVSLQGHHGAAPAVMRSLLTSSGVALASVDAYATQNRDRSLPVSRQRRYDEAHAHELSASLREASGILVGRSDVTWRLWAEAALEHVLPQLYVDSIAGGPDYLEALAPLVRHLLGGLDDDDLAQVPVSPRLAGWFAAHKGWDDVALVQAFLADHPHGLPVDRISSPQVAVILPGPLNESTPRSIRQICEGDRRLHAKVDPPTTTPGGHLVLSGAAFLDYSVDGARPGVTVVDASKSREVPSVRGAPDPRLNEWAGRAFEDHAAAGFVATLDPGHCLDTEHAMQVELILGGQRQVLEVPQRVSARDTADVVIRAAQLSGSTLSLTLEATADCGELRLQGRQASTESVRARGGSDGAWDIQMPMTHEKFGQAPSLPVGRYSIALTGAGGGPLMVAWDPELVTDPPELIGDRLRVVPVAGNPAALLVRAPLAAAERGPYAQQLMERSVYGHPPADPDDVVLFESFQGRSTGDNPGAICAELLKRGTGLDLVWVVDEPSVPVPPGTRFVARRSRAWYAALGGARAYIGNAAAPRFYRKGDRQLHLQTWHGTPLKRIGEDRGPGDLNTWRHRRMLAGQSSRWDAMLSPGEYCTEIFRSAFGFEGEMLEVGSPRNDVLMSGQQDAVRKRVRDQLGLEDSDIVLLYAPTWREYLGRRVSKPLYLDAERVTEALPRAVVLLRGHYNATREAEVFAEHPRIHDVTRYPDIAPLYLAADALVTDYSSVMFDFALTDKPILLLLPDLEQYRDVERGFYFDLETDGPGPLLRSTDEVIAALGSPDLYAGHRARFRNRFCPYEDGKASARVVDVLLDRW